MEQSWELGAGGGKNFFPSVTKCVLVRIPASVSPGGNVERGEQVCIAPCPAPSVSPVTLQRRLAHLWASLHPLSPRFLRLVRQEHLFLTDEWGNQVTDLLKIAQSHRTRKWHHLNPRLSFSGPLPLGLTSVLGCSQEYDLGWGTLRKSLYWGNLYCWTTFPASRSLKIWRI